MARIYMNGGPVAAQVYELGIPQEETPVYWAPASSRRPEMLGEHYAGDVDEIVMYNRVLPGQRDDLPGQRRPPRHSLTRAHVSAPCCRRK